MRTGSVSCVQSRIYIVHFIAWYTAFVVYLPLWFPCSRGYTYVPGFSDIRCSSLSYTPTHQHIWPNNPLNSNLSVWSIIIMFYYGHCWRYNSQIGARCRDDSEGEGCPLPSSSAKSLQESLLPLWTRDPEWAGKLGSRSLPCWPNVLWASRTPIKCQRERKNTTTAEWRRCHVTWPRLYSVAISHCLCMGIDPRLDTPWRSPGTWRSWIPSINAIGITRLVLCLQPNPQHPPNLYPAKVESHVYLGNELL